jgi:hypothetical protein
VWKGESSSKYLMPSSADLISCFLSPLISSVVIELSVRVRGAKASLIDPDGGSGGGCDVGAVPEPFLLLIPVGSDCGAITGR